MLSSRFSYRRPLHILTAACGRCQHRTPPPVLSSSHILPSHIVQVLSNTRRWLTISHLPPQLYDPEQRRTWRKDPQTFADDSGNDQAPDPAEERINPNSKQLINLIKKQIHHFDDPYQIGKHVAGLLGRKRLGEAILFVHKASRTKQIETAWNHIMDYLFKSGRPRAALKLFSEMKQRRQQPNAHSLTIIFSNLARTSHKDMAAEQALKIYMSVLQNPRLGVNTIHLNAAINACARALDIDAMFTILHTANEGSRAPDNLTYTTIFNAMRFKISADRNSRLSRDLTEEQHQENAQIVIDRCKIVWDEVISRWRTGAVVLDESLICAMCRIMVRGGPGDKRAIFEILEQTMNLPDLRRSEYNEPPRTQPRMDVEGHEGHENEEGNKGEREGVAADEPGHIDLSPMTNRHKPAGIYATPGRNTLSIILQTLSYLRASSTGLKYWNILVADYGVIPDANNWFWLLTTLKRNHASGRVAELMDVMPRDMMDRTTFRLAIEACLRDTNNPNVYRHASKIMDTMNNVLETSDPETMRKYVELALYKPTRESLVLGSGTDSFPMMVMDALGRIWNGLVMALDAVNFASHRPNSAADWHSADPRYNEKAELVSVARMIVSAYDMITTTDRGSLSKQAIESAKIRTRKLTWFIGKLYPNTRPGRDQLLGEQVLSKDRGDEQALWRKYLVEGRERL